MSQLPALTPRNTMAITALILGILAIPLALVGIGAILGILAVILGIAALTRPTRRGMAITGITFGVVAIPLAVFAAMAWILMPSLGKARQRAIETSALVHLRSLSTAVQAYAADWRCYPDHLALTSDYLGPNFPEIIRDPRLGRRPIPRFPADSESLRMLVDTQCDFHYAPPAADPTAIRRPSNVILLYDKPGSGGRRLILFADGHGESIAPGSPEIRTLVEYTNEVRRAADLPPLPADLSGPPANVLSGPQ